MDKTISEITMLWDQVLAKIKEKLNEDTVYENFFSKTYIADISGGKIVVVANTTFCKRVLSTTYKDLVDQILSDFVETKYDIVFVTEDEVEKKEEVVLTNKKTTYFKDATISPELTFDNFVVGEFNKEASQAAVFVASNPGKMFNPLFVYANSGLGKTHLLHSIGNYIQKYTIPGAKILYITANDFVEEYIKFVKGEKEAESLKDYISSFDVLLLDDVQFLANKVKTEEMFFYIYEKMVNSNKQIVISSDRQPNELNGLEERLVTRFSRGLVIKINEPDQNTCVEILKKKIDSRNLDLEVDDAVIYFFAEKFSQNVRELEGALNRLIFYAVSFKPTRHVTLEIAAEAVSSLVGGKSIASALSEQRIINVVADYYNLSPFQLTGKVRTGQIALARHIAMYLIRSILDIPLKKIGQTFGGKDHTTVMSAISKVEKGLKTDPLLKEAVDELETRLKN